MTRKSAETFLSTKDALRTIRATLFFDYKIIRKVIEIQHNMLHE